jgi:hypothetical protein
LEDGKETDSENVHHYHPIRGLKGGTRTKLMATVNVHYRLVQRLGRRNKNLSSSYQLLNYILYLLLASLARVREASLKKS